MQYWKTNDLLGFVSVSTIDADGNGNIEKDEYDMIVLLYRDAPNGYGIIETNGELKYALFSSEIDNLDSDVLTLADKAEAYDILVGEAT